MQEIARDRTISCRPQSDPPSYACTQSIPNDRDHYSVLAVTARPARKPLRPGEILVENQSVGPGGGGFTSIGQTSDHRYDIVVTQAESMPSGTPRRLPSASQLSSRITALYPARR